MAGTADASSTIGSKIRYYKPQSTFRTEKFNIRCPPQSCTTLLEEAIFLLRRHFLNRHLFSDATWERFRTEFSEYSDPHTALTHLMSKFQDPFTRFIPESIMSERQNVIRGERGCLGIELKRVWNWQVARTLIKGLRAVPDVQIPPRPPATQFWEKLGFALDTICPILLAGPLMMMKFNHGIAQIRRMVGVACLLSVLLSTTRRILPIVRPFQVTALSDSASKAGLQLGDLLLCVDNGRVLNKSRRGMQKLLDEGGDIGEAVSLGVVRPPPRRQPGFLVRSGVAGAQHPYLEVNVIREAALLTKVRANMLPASQGPALGYLQIEEFTDNTFFEVKSALAGLGPELQALIIDLRGNPGGPLGSALDVAAMFLPAGTVLTQTVIRGSKERHTSLNHEPDKKMALLLLTDSSTASASEILVASLKENKRADTLGRTTVGKNVAQAIMMLSDGSGLAFTVAEYLTPKGASMAQGLEPDRVVFERDMGAGLVDKITWSGRGKDGRGGEWKCPQWILQKDSTLPTEAPPPQKFAFGLSSMNKL